MDSITTTTIDMSGFSIVSTNKLASGRNKNAAIGNGLVHVFTSMLYTSMCFGHTYCNWTIFMYLMIDRLSQEESKIP